MGKELRGVKVDEKEFDRLQAIILSMTPQERRHPELIKGSQRPADRPRVGHQRAGGQAADQAVRADAQGHAPGRRRWAECADALTPRRLTAPGTLTSSTANGSQTSTHSHRRAEEPIWRVVVADQRSKRDGRVIETVGHYNAQTDPSTIVLNEERIRDWLARGAQPSETVRKLLRTQGIS